ncbi:biosynthetic arginine decarboxylase [soil metagenome]
MTISAPKPRFTVQDADELYNIPAWGSRYFGVDDHGNLTVSAENQTEVALSDIVHDLKAQGKALPLILRFPQIIESRIARLNGAFENAIRESGYQNRYQGVYPIKVNQRRVVVETIAEYGEHYRTGLEAGSKAELALCLVQDTHPEALLCCNGFKDDDFVRLALWGRKLGKNVVITLEKYSELDRVLRISKEIGIKPALGVRFKLHARGSGQWESSGGDDAKFGLTATEMISVATRLQALGMADALIMIHCHVGSQVTDIRRVKVAVREAAQAYVELREMGVPVGHLNVGGGLAVDYDGSKTTFYVSANYGIQEYADTVVYTVQEACKEWEVPEPILVSESGRALTAHHAVVVLPVIDAVGPTREPLELPPLSGEPHALVKDMRDLLESLNAKTYREVYNEAVGNKDTMHNLFDLGYLSLLERAHIENLFNRILVRIAKLVQDLDYVSDEFENLPKLLADKYICNFSLFQTLPDHWAIGALFPIAPLARLNETPTRDATLVDISCDSDGKISKFIDLRDVKSTLRLHELKEGEPYYLGIFLTGAYQDVLANAHNLFGRVNEAHVRLTDTGFVIERFINGQKARRVIENMGYEAPELHGWLGEEVTEAKTRGTLTDAEAIKLTAVYDAELVGYTYLKGM